jgi:HEAT repeat protein
MFSRFVFEPISFLIGFITATLLWWLIAAARPLIEQARENARKAAEEARARTTSAGEDSYRRIVFKRAQKMHIAASLFSLDEIAQPVRLIAPPAVKAPGLPPFHEDIVEQTVPYLPGWPELAATYNARTLSFGEALSGGLHLVITGQAGTGRSFALASIASQMANRAPEAANLQQFIPVLAHVADLNLARPIKTPADLLTDLIDLVEKEAGLFETNLATFIQQSFEGGRALLLMDGFDELPPANQQEVINFLKQLLKAYPRTRVVATGIYEQLDGLFNLGFTPMAIMPWNSDQQQAFLKRWADLWVDVSKESWAQTGLGQVDPLIINTWIGSDNLNFTPLEFTLKVWGAYAGDALGPRGIDAIATHVRRLSPANTPVEAMGHLALQSNLATQPVFDERRAKEWVKRFEPKEVISPEPSAEEGQPQPEQPAAEGEAPSAEIKPDAKARGKKDKKGTAAPAAPRDIVWKMSTSGLLSAHRDDNLRGGVRRFAHPIFAAFLTGKGLAESNDITALANQPDWHGKDLSLRYCAAFGDITPYVDATLAQTDPILARPVFTVARWLKYAPRQISWRGKIMAALVGLFQKADVPAGLRLQIVMAFVQSNDPAVATLFRQFISAQAPDIRRAVALGSGMLQDAKAVDGLTALLNDYSSQVRAAACLALVAIGTHNALEAVANALITGDEDLRRAAAEAFATHPAEGHPVLRDAVHSEDILMRRAAIFGLQRVNEPWAIALLEKMQTEDQQWVVRNAAVEAVESSKRADPRIPRKLTPPSETPWVIEFAARYGMGVTPNQPATDLLLLALKSEKHEERNGALAYLRYMPSEGVVIALYNAIYGDDTEMRDAAFNMLSEMASASVAMPDPHQFGLG